MQAIVAGMLLVPGATGCYSYQAVTGPRAIEPGTYVSLAITDRGRVGLSERMGSGILKLNGRLRTASDSMYVVNVESVDYISAGTAHWAGETVNIPTDYVGNVSTRKVSRARSWLAAGIIVGAIALVAATISILGSGLGGDDDGKPGGNPSDS
jgi:hypothetical protein